MMATNASLYSLLKDVLKYLFGKGELMPIEGDMEILYDTFKYRDISIGRVTEKGLEFKTAHKINLRTIGSTSNRNRVGELFDEPFIFTDDNIIRQFSLMSDKADSLPIKLRKLIAEAGLGNAAKSINPEIGMLIVGNGSGNYFLSDNPRHQTLRDYYRILVDIKEMIERLTGRQFSID